MNDQIDKILDDFGHDVINGAERSSKEVQRAKVRIQKLIVEEELKEFKRYKYIFPGNVLEPMRSEYFFGERIGQLEEQLKELEK